MKKEHFYLIEKIKSSIYENKYQNYTLLINHKQQQFDNYIHINVQYIKNTSKYIAELNINELVEYNELEFTLFSEKSSKYLLNYIINYLTCEEDCFYKKANSIIIHDYHVELLKIKSIKINNTTINNETINTINKYFSNLESIEFNDCIIKENCNFYKTKSLLLFQNCEIESINCLSYCEQQVTLKNTKINKVTNSIINSTKIYINDLNDLALRNIFLLCHFPDLTELIIGDYNLLHNTNKYYEKSLLYLPYSCPKLRSLFIEGKIYSFDFLYHFKDLDKCEIRSINDSIGYFEIYNPYIAKKSERDRIAYDSKCNSNSNLDTHLAIYEKLQSILKSLSCINYSEDEKDIYINKNVAKILLNSLSNFKDKPVEHIYTYDLNKESLELVEKNIYKGKNYSLVNNKLLEYEKVINGSYIKSNPQITTCKPFIYHPSLIPIIFSKKTLSHKEHIKNAISMANMFTIGYNRDNDIEELFPGDYNEKVDTSKEKIRIDSLTEKEHKYFSLLIETIISNYNKFNTEEIIEILRLIENINPSIRVESYYKIPYITNSDDILKNIDNKTSGNFSKYLSRTKMLKKQKNCRPTTTNKII